MPEPSPEGHGVDEGGADAHGARHAAVGSDRPHLRPSGVRFSTARRVKNTAMANSTIQKRFQVIDSPPRSKLPDIQVGLATSLLVGP